MGRHVVPLLTAQLAVTVAAGLAGFVIAVGHLGLGIILAHPGEDVLGVERDFVAEVALRRQLGIEQAHRRLEEKARLAPLQRAQHPTEVAGRRQAALHIKAPAIRRRGHQRKAKEPHQRRLLD